MAQASRSIDTSRGRRFSEETVAGWVAISPWVIGFIIFTAGPIVASVYFSMTDYDVLTPARWVGLENYRELLTDDDLFPKAVMNSLIYTLLYVPLHIATALAVALLLNEARQATGIFRTIFYLPSITPLVATAYLWISIMNPNDGWVNRSLRAANLPAPAWTVDPFWTKPTIVISQLWLLGGAMIILLAGMKGIPQHLYEAARLDGANAFQRFKDVTLPMLSSVLFFVATVSLIAALQVFTQGYVMYDRDGGPGNSALFVMMYLFKQAFEYFNMGYASAIAWLLFLVIVGATMIQFRLSKRWVYYEAGRE
jgi:multiple sugar transport system permease protein